MDLKALHEKLEEWTRVGKRGMVIDSLKKLDRSRCQVDDLIAFSKIANRNHLYTLSLKFLYKDKQTTEEQKKSLSTDFITTYSAALLGIGATEEAQKLLKTQLENPQALFSYSLSHFSTWSYESAITYFKKYLRLQPDGYMHLVGRINLIAAFIGSGDYQSGKILLSDFMKDIKDNPRATILYANCWEIKAQIEIEEKDFRQALQSLNFSKTIFKDQLTRYLLYVNKWEAVAELALNPGSLENQQKLMNIKHQAKTLRNWETMRDCDFQLARFTQNSKLMQRTLWGTPFPDYHDRVRILYGYEIQSEKDFLFVPEENENLSGSTSVDLIQPADVLIQQTQCLNLLRVLTRDFYKPPRFGVLHAELHPAEYYNPFTSAQGIRNTILRLNKLNGKMQNGLVVKVEGGDVFLHSLQGKALRIQNSKRLFEKKQYWLQLICANFKGKRFTTSSLENLIDLSKRSLIEVLNYGIQKNKLKKYGLGKATYYKISNNN
jgi:tetratricopeptide (TPR) repeat protein